MAQRQSKRAPLRSPDAPARHANAITPLRRIKASVARVSHRPPVSLALCGPHAPLTRFHEGLSCETPPARSLAAALALAGGQELIFGHLTHASVDHAGRRALKRAGLAARRP